MILSSKIENRCLHTRLVERGYCEFSSIEGALRLSDVDLTAYRTLHHHRLSHRKDGLPEAVVGICHQYAQFTDLCLHREAVEGWISVLLVLFHKVRRDDRTSGRYRFPRHRLSIETEENGYGGDELVLTESTHGCDASGEEQCLLDETERHILRNTFPLETGCVDLRIMEKDILRKNETFTLPALSLAEYE